MTAASAHPLPLALGGNAFGWTADAEESAAVLDAFVAAGGTHIDTADVYSAWVDGNSGGESEAIIGDWLAETGARDRVYIATKAGIHPELTGLDESTARRALENSLTRLRTDRIDLYYAHKDDESQTPAQLAQTFGKLADEGVISAIGMSNFSVERQRAWIDAARDAGLPAPTAVQPQYSLLHRGDVEGAQLDLAREAGLEIFSYFSLASGMLTGKYRKAEDTAGTARENRTSKHTTPEAFAVVDAVVAAAESAGAKPAAVALAWLRAKGVTAPIASARTPEQLADLIAGAQLTLSPETVAALDEVSQPFA